MGNREAPFSPKLSNSGDGDSSFPSVLASGQVYFTYPLQGKGNVDVIKRDISNTLHCPKLLFK